MSCLCCRRSWGTSSGGGKTPAVLEGKPYQAGRSQSSQAPTTTWGGSETPDSCTWSGKLKGIGHVASDAPFCLIGIADPQSCQTKRLLLFRHATEWIMNHCSVILTPVSICNHLETFKFLHFYIVAKIKNHFFLLLQPTFMGHSLIVLKIFTNIRFYHILMEFDFQMGENCVI